MDLDSVGTQDGIDLLILSHKYKHLRVNIIAHFEQGFHISPYSYRDDNINMIQ
jgi:hypothetical protein